METKIDVLDPETHAFHETEARAVQQLCHQLKCTGHGGEQLVGLFVGQDGGEVVLAEKYIRSIAVCNNPTS